MTNNARVINVTRNFSMKHKQAVKAVENRACAWVEFGKTLRDLTLAESIALRNEDARLAQPIASAEIPGIKYEPSPRNQASTRQSYSLISEANKFCAEYVG